MTKKIYLLIAMGIVVALLGPLFIRNLIDFPVYYAAGQSLLKGRTDLYSADFARGRVMDYRYPPFFLVVFTPLWLIRYSLSAYIWYLLSALEIAGCVIVLRRMFAGLVASKAMWLVIGLATIEYFVMALHYGNVHLLAIFLLFLSVYCAANDKSLLAGLFMALSITLKLIPVLLLPYLLLKKKWKMLTAVAVFLLLINLSPSAYFGVQRNNELLAAWYNHVVASQEFHEDNGPIDLSLKGELRRYLSSVDYSRRVDGDVQYPAINLATFQRDTVVWVWFAIGGVVFVAALLLVGFAGRTSSHVPMSTMETSSFACEISLMICLMLFVGPLTSKIYFVALLWPITALASFAIEGEEAARKVAMGVLLSVALINSVLPLLPGRSLQRLLLVLGVDFYLNCLVMAALAFALISSYRAIRTPAGELQTPAQSTAKTP